MKSVLMCHAPIVIPEIAEDRQATVKSSTRAMREAAAEVIAANPDVIIIVSPHTVRLGDTFSIATGDSLHGDFGRFGFPSIQFTFSGNPKAAEKILNTANALELAMTPLPQRYADDLDHGAGVPLYFLYEQALKQNWRGSVVAIGFPDNPSLKECEKMGQVLKKAAANNWALIASGDMSHRLSEDAPAGYNREAKKFDEKILEAVKNGQINNALSIDPRLRDLAGEDVLESLAVAAGTNGTTNSGTKILSYEGPFGVGYLVAIL